ncbi:MAG: TatD family hydrolase [Candidatus Dojkabacteria bacterium]|nr:TatD family hydrolase [Candidatus Dojkabacteria bacterium]
MHDSHIHLTMEPPYSNLDELITRFKDMGGKYILSQSTDLVDYKENINIRKKYSDTVQLALGLHPTVFQEITVDRGDIKNIFEKSKKYISEFENIFRKNRKDIKAIGETGLDYYHFNLDNTIGEDIKEQLKQVQRLSFEKHLELAREFCLPLSIHARDVIDGTECVEDILNIIVKSGKGCIKGSFHSYTGNLESLKYILDLGFYIGFNAIITYKSGENVRDILRNVPVERILLETDGPFLPPQSIRKDKSIKEKYAQPSSVKEILEVMAKIKDIDINKLEDITDSNYTTLFGV